MNVAQMRPARLLSAALLIPALGGFVFDRALKWWIVEGLDLKHRLVIEVAPPYLRLVMAWNEGANFGIGSALSRDVWIAVALIISAGLLAWATTMRDALRLVSVGLIVGGALGNALDRVVYGAVADFLNMSCCGIRNPFAFNPADIFIFAGAFGLILFDGREKSGE
ncbi:MAG: signal peptidase II [Pseudomonadota bacterium]